jgi:hypothetical protein
MLEIHKRKPISADSFPSSLTIQGVSQSLMTSECLVSHIRKAVLVLSSVFWSLVKLR